MFQTGRSKLPGGNFLSLFAGCIFESRIYLLFYSNKLEWVDLDYLMLYNETTLRMIGSKQWLNPRWWMISWYRDKMPLFSGLVTGVMLDSMFSSMTTSMQLAQECLRQDQTEGDPQVEAAQPFEGLEMFAQTIEAGEWQLFNQGSKISFSFPCSYRNIFFTYLFCYGFLNYIVCPDDEIYIN